jgi:hypothetical protein
MRYHENMFSHYETYDEAYNAFLKNQESDTKAYKFCFCVAMALLPRQFI